MTIAVGTATTFATIGNREDLIDTIYMISPTDTPAQANFAKTKATATLHEWQTDSLVAAGANAALEGDDPYISSTLSSATFTTRIGNRCQISSKTLVVSGTADTISKAGRKREYVYQLMKRSKELRRDMEFVLTNNQAQVVGTSTSARQLKPLRGFYSTNTSLGTGAGAFNSGASQTSAAGDSSVLRILTESLVKSMIQSAWTQGGNPDLLMCGPFNKTVISGFTGNNTRMQDTSDKKLVTAIDVYTSDFGTHRIVPNKFQRERDLNILTTDLWGVAYLRPMFTKDLADTGDASKGMIICEYTLEARNEAGSAIVADLTTS